LQTLTVGDFAKGGIQQLNLCWVSGFGRFNPINKEGFIKRIIETFAKVPILIVIKNENNLKNTMTMKTINSTMSGLFYAMTRPFYPHILREQA
jgi:hypothetical protein